MKVSLTNIAGGRLVELFESEFVNVLENISDLKTKATATRELTIKVKINPTEDRMMGDTEVSCRSMLAPQRPNKAFIYFDTDNGKLVAETNDPRQKELFGLVPPDTKKQEVSNG